MVAASGQPLDSAVVNLSVPTGASQPTVPGQLTDMFVAPAQVTDTDGRFAMVVQLYTDETRQRLVPDIVTAYVIASDGLYHVGGTAEADSVRALLTFVPRMATPTAEQIPDVTMRVPAP